MLYKVSFEDLTNVISFILYNIISFFKHVLIIFVQNLVQLNLW